MIHGINFEVFTYSIHIVCNIIILTEKNIDLLLFVKHVSLAESYVNSALHSTIGDINDQNVRN
jgi:hypothetical protein